MKRLLTITLAVLLIAAVTAPALAWEFSMTGQWELRMRYWGRMGNTDLFGMTEVPNVQAVNDLNGNPVRSIGLAGPNIYNRGAVPAFFSDSAAGRMVITRGGFSQSESDAFQDDTRLMIVPDIRPNSAIRVHGVYNVGGVRHRYFQNVAGAPHFGNAAPMVAPLERYSTFRTSENAYDVAGFGCWDQYRATIQTPWAVFTVGQKDFPVGVGTVLGYNTRSDGFLWIVPYGPLRVFLNFWPARGLMGAGSSHRTVPDAATKRAWSVALLYWYNDGPISWGGGIGAWNAGHANRQEIINNGMGGGLGVPDTGVPATGVVAAADSDLMLYMNWFLYNNGRVFVNIEYDWAVGNLYRRPFDAPAYTPIGDGRPERHDEAYSWFSEVGAFAGPSKVSLVYAIVSGPVLNDPNRTKNYRPLALNDQVIRGYQYLMFDTYAGGNNGGWSSNDINITPDEVGKMTDAFCFGGRVDYAVASNLNLYGTFMWAHRLEKAGFYKGGILSTGATATDDQIATFVANNFGGTIARNTPREGFLFQGNVNPYVDDGLIGWEANAGFDWKLLENFTFSMRYAYWQPGEWFEQAYQAVGMRGGAAVADAVIKDRSPIIGLWANMIVNF